MAKKIVKKKKLKVGKLIKLLFGILVLLGLFFALYLYLKLPINNLIVVGNNYLEDDYILELAGVKEYPSFWLTSMMKGEKNLKKDKYIVDADIKRRFYHKIEITITENRALFYKEIDSKTVFSDKKEIKVTEYEFRVPRLMNYVPDVKYKAFIKGMNNINEDILMKISDIEYVPNELDKDRFLLYMDDGNMVYLTLTKFKQINYYNDVLSQLEDKKGILYLDNGNHFQIMG